MLNFDVTLKATGQRFNGESTKFPEHVQVYLFEYGLRQVLQDAYADEKTDSGKAGAAKDKFDNLLAGVLRQVKQADPLTKMATDIAVAVYAKKDGKQPKRTDPRVVKAAQSAKIQKVAKARLAENAALEID